MDADDDEVVVVVAAALSERLVVGWPHFVSGYGRQQQSRRRDDGRRAV